MTQTELHSALVDYLLELYCEWREDSARVQTAYDRFASADSEDRDAAFASYMAALDQEESAAQTYAEQIKAASAQLKPQDEVTSRDPAPARSTEIHRAPSSSRT
jgi:membrane-bound lytic murein transglycosylase B